MFWYSSLLQKPWFFRINNYFFKNKTSQDFADFWDFCGNFNAKTKTEDEEILKKRKLLSSWFLLLHITSIGWRDSPNFCYVKHPSVMALADSVSRSARQSDRDRHMSNLIFFIKTNLNKWVSCHRFWNLTPFGHCPPVQ